MWVEKILQIKADSERKMPSFAKHFSIAYAAGQYQGYIRENYEKAVQ